MSFQKAYLMVCKKAVKKVSSSHWVLAQLEYHNNTNVIIRNNFSGSTLKRIKVTNREVKYQNGVIVQKDILAILF